MAVMELDGHFLLGVVVSASVFRGLMRLYIDLMLKIMTRIGDINGTSQYIDDNKEMNWQIFHRKLAVSLHSA